MIDVNQISFTGEVISGEKNAKGTYLKVFQKVAGQKDTTFTVFAPAKTLSDISFNEKDVLFINNGLIYESDDGFTVRVTRPDQIQLLQKNFDLGFVKIEDELV